MAPMVRRPTLRPAAALLLLLGCVLPAGSCLSAREPPADVPRAPAPPPAESEPDSYRPLGPNLFPLYTHELRTSDETEILQVLGLYRETSRPDGSGSRLLLPLFYQEHSVDPPRDRLFVFPLYYQGRTGDASYRHLIPFYFHFDDPASTFSTVPPLWFRTSSDEKRVIRDRVLFPLYRRTDDRRNPDYPETLHRVGIPYLLELFESRSTPDLSHSAALTFFNFQQETRGGLSLYRNRWVEEEEGVHGSTYLFPFYWRGKGVGSDWLWVVPLFGHSRTGGRRDLTLVPLLSRYGYGPGDATRIDVLFPLFHYAQSSDEFSIASYPFFDYYNSPNRRRLGILFWVYRDYLDRELDRRVQAILFPLGYFRETGGGREGFRTLFPYFETWDSESRLRLVLPFHLRTEDLVAGETDWFLSIVLPTYAAWGHPEDWFAMGIPLYWASQTGPRGWDVFFPFWWNFYTGISKDRFLIPFFGYRSSPAHRRLYVGGPLYVYEKSFGLEEEVIGTSHSVLWPLITVATHEEGYSYRVLPLFWAHRRQEAGGLLLTPFFYRQWSPAGTSNYFFPFYARFDGPRATWDAYAGGLYTHARSVADDGSLVAERHDILWWLGSTQRNYRQGTTHQRFLPFAFWRTTSPAEDLTIAGPFWFSSRSVEHDETTTLDLLLGNLWYSERRTARQRVPGPPPSSGAAGPEADAIPTAAGRIEDPTVAGGELDTEPATTTVEKWRDQGVLWPLIRWYRGADGDHGFWTIPFYFKTHSDTDDHLAIFPAAFLQSSRGRYQASYFRYFFLFDHETFADGERWTFGQVLFDYYRDDVEDRSRWRFLYPLLEFNSSERLSSYEITPLIAGERRLEGGERSRRHRVFPIYWQGATERVDDEGNWQPESSHLFVFPLFGMEARTTRRDWHLLYPFIHWQTSTEAFAAELWPLFFYRRNPGLHAVRFWPFHAHETGETSEDFWVPKYLFLSKYLERAESFQYRLDPFLIRVESGPGRFGIGALFEALAWDRSPEGISYRFLPISFGYSGDDSALSAVIPVHYREENRVGPIDYWSPWRFFFLTSFLEGADGERHFSVLTKLYDYTYNPERPQYREHRFLHRLVFSYRSESASQFEINPFWQYYRDDVEDLTVFSIPILTYREETHQGRTRRSLLFFIEF